MNIGLTGGIATGKSTVSLMLAERGAAIVDADRIAREVVEPGQAPLRQIAETFGAGVLSEDGSLNRRRLGEIVFADEAQRKALEAITHPAIRAHMRERMDKLERERPDRLVVVDVPLLYESGLQSFFEQVLVVYAPRDVQLRRLISRDGFSEEEALRRLNAQMDIEDKKKLADIVVDNGGDPAWTEEQVDRFWRDKPWR